MSRLENTIFQHSPARRSMSTTGVINLVDDDSNSPPAIRRRITEPAHDEDIIILDHDHGRRVVNGTANRPIVISDNNADAGPWNRRQSYRIFSPPPPPPMFHPIPPVPQIPPPVIANSQPFAILAPPRGPEDTLRRRVPFDEPPQPSTSTAPAPRGNGIQLGGGLVSQGFRPRRGGHASRGNDTPAGVGADGPPRAGRIVATFVNEPGPPATQPTVIPALHNNDEPRQRTRFGDIWSILSIEPMRNRGVTRFFGVDPVGLFDAHHGRRPFQRRDEAIGLGPDYTKEMTHPGAPPPGWSFNFGTEEIDVDVDNDTKTKPTASSEVLVCAMCLDPLYANIDGRNDLSTEEKKRRRIWALRCGHMFDGKCMETFMAPTWTRERPSTTMKEDEKPFVVLTDEIASSSGEGKGKGKEKMKDDVLELSLDTVHETTVPPVSIPDTPASSSQPEPEVQLLDSVSSSSQTTVGSTSTTAPAPKARYNLRTRRTRQETPTANASPTRSTRRGRGTTAAQDALAFTPPRRTTTTTRGTKRKFGEEKVIREEDLRKNEARYNWSCRVAGCGKRHSSYNWQGEWKPDEENGPIAVYI